MGDMQKKIVILGAGYGGLSAAVTLQRKMKLKEAEVILVNKDSYHHITTWLHELAAGTSPADKCMVDLESVLEPEKIKLLKAEVETIDLGQKEVHLSNGKRLSYDYLVVALGSEIESFGVPGVKEHTYVIRNLKTAMAIRDQVERMFSRCKMENYRPERLHFVICGSGFTGVEFAGELADRIDELCKEYRIDRNKVLITNVEASPSVLSGFDPELSEYAKEVLEKKGVVIKTSTPVKACTSDGVILHDQEECRSSTVVWTAGVRGHSITKRIKHETVRGRLKVDEYLRPPDHDDVFVIGDSSIIYGKNGGPYPPTAQIAVQQGAACAHNLLALLENKPLQAFEPRIKGTIVSIGKKVAAGNIYGFKLYGSKASFVKKVVDYHYLYRIGGLKLLLEKLKGGEKQEEKNSLLDH